jgi:hypothetical protein
MAEAAAPARINDMIVDVLREVAAESGTGHIGSEHIALLAVRGSGGLAELADAGADAITAALRQPCRLTRAIPPEQPTMTVRAARLVRNAIVLAEMHGRPVPTAAELVGALLNEPGCEAWRDLEPLGVTPSAVEAAQRAAFARDGIKAVVTNPPPPGPAKVRLGD